MKCPFCGANEKTQFRLVAVADNPQADPAYAYNLFQCECDAICRKNMWANPGELWVHHISNETIEIIPLING